MKPTFIGLGAQKAATSWIYAVLMDHPRVRVSWPKEIDFFSKYFERGFQWYESFFENPSGHIAIGEVSPSYLHDKEAPQRAHQYNPDFRVIVSLRDPVDRAYSNHLHAVRLRLFTGEDLSFEAGLANNPMYLERSRYNIQLKRWLEFFKRNQILVIVQEEIRKQPSEHARLLYRHVGVDESYCSDVVDKKVNESFMPKSLGREKTYQTLGRALRRSGAGGLVERAKQINLLSSFRRSNRLDVRTLVPPLNPDTRAQLETHFANDVLELTSLLGRESLPWPTWRRARDGAKPSSAPSEPDVTATETSL